MIKDDSDATQRWELHHFICTCLSTWNAASLQEDHCQFLPTLLSPHFKKICLPAHFYGFQFLFFSSNTTVSNMRQALMQLKWTEGVVWAKSVQNAGYEDQTMTRLTVRHQVICERWGCDGTDKAPWNEAEMLFANTLFANTEISAKLSKFWMWNKPIIQYACTTNWGTYNGLICGYLLNLKFSGHVP